MGSGHKVWSPGDKPTATEFNGYISDQVIMTFADASARDTALSGVLAEGMFAYLSDVNNLTRYNGTAWHRVGAATGRISTATGTTSDTTTAGGDVTLTYGVTFAAQPTLFVMPRIGSNNQITPLQPSAPGTTTATIRFTSNDAVFASSAITFDWVAYGLIVE